MDSWKGLLIAFVLVALFSISLINYAVIMQVTNNVNNTILSVPIFSQFNNSVYGNISDLSVKSSSYYAGVQNESSSDIQPQGALTMGSIYHSLTSFGGFLFSFGNSFFNLLSYIGVSAVIITVLIVILSIVVILLFWRLIKWGQ